MNQELESKLAEAVEKAIAVAEQTGEFVIDQAPDLLREFYTWAIVSNSIGIIIGAAFLFGMFKLSRVFGSGEIPKSEHTGRVYEHKAIGGRYFKRESFDGYVGMGSFLTCRILGFALGGGAMVIELTDLIKVIVAPKLYLIQYFIN